jgi:heme/copper-type cytochrome/quinol oxidase subunit 2
LVVPRGKPIKLNVTSEDVLHSLFIPAFRIKVDAVNGMQTYAWFLPDKVGTYIIQCAEYCGVGHSAMIADLRIVSPEEYLKWLQEDEDE